MEGQRILHAARGILCIAAVLIAASCGASSQATAVPGATLYDIRMTIAGVRP
jgi:hypothetical protein